MDYKFIFPMLLLGIPVSCFSTPQASAGTISCTSYLAGMVDCYTSRFDSFSLPPSNPADSTPIAPIKIKPRAYIGYKKMCVDYLKTQADLYNRVQSFDSHITPDPNHNPISQGESKLHELRLLVSNLTSVSNIVHKYGCDDPSIVTTLTPAEARANTIKVFPEVFGIAPNQSEINYWVALSLDEGFGPVTMKIKMQYYKGLGKTTGTVKAISKTTESVSAIGANVPAIVERIFSRVYGRKITPSESTYWKQRARTDKTSEVLLKEAMQFSKPR